VNLIIKQGAESDSGLRAKAVAHLSKFINIREPNIRYLGLETMSRLTNLEGTGDAIRKQQVSARRNDALFVLNSNIFMQATIMFSLKDADISIRRRALDLLFAMCDRSIAESVVKELLQVRLGIAIACAGLLCEFNFLFFVDLQYLVIADFAIKDEMVLKLAILAERFSPNLRWYDTDRLGLSRGLYQGCISQVCGYRPSADLHRG
jgi:AP-2 complex subunit alpha